MRDLATLPKAHLHLHFTGSMRTATVVELAQAHAMKLPNELRLSSPRQLPAGERGWFRFQRLYDIARKCVRSEADIRRVVREAALDDAAEGSGHLELQIDPTSYAPLVGGITPVMEIVVDEATIASRTTGTEVNLIVAASRLRHPLDARTLARLAAQFAGDHPGGVVGFGLNNDERRGNTIEFAPAFEIARRAGLASVPHGGELLGPDHVIEVIEDLRPDRIGHGVRAAEREDALQYLVERGVTLELCPLSNVALGVFGESADVPLRRIFNSGASIALAADDPVIFASRLVDQYQTAREVHGFSDDELAKLASDSIAASRTSHSTKARLLQGVRDWLRSPDPVRAGRP